MLGAGEGSPEDLSVDLSALRVGPLVLPKLSGDVNKTADDKRLPGRKRLAEVLFLYNAQLLHRQPET